MRALLNRERSCAILNVSETLTLLDKRNAGISVFCSVNWLFLVFHNSVNSFK